MSGHSEGRGERRPDILSSLRAGWWLLPIVLAAALAAAAFVNHRKTSRTGQLYEASMTMAVVPDSSLRNKNQLLRGVQMLQRESIVNTLSELPVSRPVRRRAAARLGSSLEDLEGYVVRATVLPDTHVIRISVQGSDPKIVSRFAGAVAAATKKEARAFYRIFDLRRVEWPKDRGRPVDRDERRTYVVAGVLGLFIGVGTAYGVGQVRV